MSPRIRRLFAMAGALTTFGLIFGWFVLFRPVSLGGPAGYIIVSGHSMEPTFLTGDLAITQRQDTYAVGDVVAFAADRGVVIHRIVGGDADQGYTVQGDNKESPDLWRPRPASIMGKVSVLLPRVGVLFAIVRQPPVLGALAAGVVFFLVFTAGEGARSNRVRASNPGNPRLARLVGR